MFGPAFFVSLADAYSTDGSSSSGQSSLNSELLSIHAAPLLNAPLVMCFVDNSLEAFLVVSAYFLIPVPAHVPALPTALMVEFSELPSSITLRNYVLTGVTRPLRFIF